MNATDKLTFEEMYFGTNDEGINQLFYIKNFKTPVLFVRGESNWHYVITSDGSIYYISNKSDCNSGYFGDLQHLKKLVRDGHASQSVYEMIEFFEQRK